MSFPEGAVPPGGEPPRPEPPGNPWEQRDRLGLWPALVETVKLFVTAPGEAYARTREKGDILSPLLYAVILGWAGVLLSQVWSFLFQSTIQSFIPAEVRDKMVGLAAGALGTMAWLLMAPVFITIGLFIGAGILHLCLMLVGGTEKSESGFEGTFRVIGYSATSNLAQVLPLLGGLVAWVWGIVLLVIGFVRLHRTTQGKAIVAVLIPMLLCCACCIAIAVMFAAGIAAAIQGAQ